MPITSASLRRVVYLLLLARTAPAQQGMTGYTAKNRERQQQVEAQYNAIPKAEEARRQHRFFTAEPHPAGSERANVARERRPEGPRLKKKLTTKDTKGTKEERRGLSHPRL